MESSAQKIEPAAVQEVERTRAPDLTLHLKGNGRAIAVAKFRELADKLERGELDGARIQWRARHEEEVAQDLPSEMVTVTVTPHTAKVGTVQLLTHKIEEV